MANYRSGVSREWQQASDDQNRQIEAARVARANQQNVATNLPQTLASMADPWAPKRQEAGNSLSALLSNPGGQETSPFFKYLQETQMNQVKSSNAAKGLTNSGRGLMALQDRAAGVASQSFFPLANLYAGISGANQNPAAGSNAFMDAYKFQNTLQGGGGSRGAPAPRQTLASMGRPPAGPGAAAPQAGTFGLPYSDAQWNGSMGFGGYTPSSGAGTGYAVSDYGTTQFRPGLASYQPDEQWEYA